ncbi:MAG: hypothetical protein P0111_08090 [Nitrospira sp.]|nr:hypothetical protein [Nitrospira sp.]
MAFLEKGIMDGARERALRINLLTATSPAAGLKFVVLIGIVSLFADMTYEAARSITGPYLALLGASGTIVGTVAGFGELIGYGLRRAWCCGGSAWALRTRS